MPSWPDPGEAARPALQLLVAIEPENEPLSGDETCAPPRARSTPRPRRPPIRRDGEPGSEIDARAVASDPDVAATPRCS